MNKNQKIGILKIVILVLAIVAITIGISYAIFTAQIGNGAQTPIKGGSSDVEQLTFGGSTEPIILAMTQDSLAQGTGLGKLLSGNVSVTLKANSTSTSQTYTYYIYLYIKSNNFIYTTSSNAPEIVLAFYDDDGSIVQSVTGLTYVHSGNYPYLNTSGFDITIKKGLYNLTTESTGTIPKGTSMTKTYNYKVGIQNLPFDQQKNVGHKMEAYIIISPEELTVAKAETLVG